MISSTNRHRLPSGKQQHHGRRYKDLSKAEKMSAYIFKEIKTKSSKRNQIFSKAVCKLVRLKNSSKVQPVNKFPF